MQFLSSTCCDELMVQEIILIRRFAARFAKTR